MYKVQQSSSPCIPTNENPTGLPKIEPQQRPASNSPVKTNPPQQNDPIITMEKVREYTFKGAEAVSYVLHKAS